MNTSIITYEVGSKKVQGFVDNLPRKLAQKNFGQVDGQTDLNTLRQIGEMFQSLLACLPEDHEVLTFETDDVSEMSDSGNFKVFNFNNVFLDSDVANQETDPADLMLDDVVYDDEQEEALCRILEISSLFYESQFPYYFKMEVSREKVTVEMEISVVNLIKLSA